MQFPLYIVDAFTLNDQPFSGNAAGVCVLQFDNDISDEMKQKIAFEMNISETAFVAKAWNNKSLKFDKNSYTLRWFTPTTEVDLCGHATLATAQVIFDRDFKNAENSSNKIRFESKFKGTLEAVVNSTEKTITLDFPQNDCKPLDKCTNPWIEDIVKYTLGPELNPNIVIDVQYSYGTKKLLLRLADRPESEKLIYKVTPNLSQLLQIDSNGLVRGVIVTQKSERVHFVSRYFTPWNGINEDPVNGSAHTVLTPYWNRQYKESGVEVKELIGQQCSQRGGTVVCKVVGNRVELSGKTRSFFSGLLTI